MVEITGSVDIEVVETNQPPFIPGGPSIPIILQPLAGSGPFLPPSGPFGAPGFVAPDPVKALIINIETTGLKPWDSRIISISAMDPRDPKTFHTFADKDEQMMMRQFLDFFNAGDFEQLIGYNVSFDFRFLFSRIMLYQIKNRRFLEMELLDVMQIMKQVQLKFVFGFNKPGSLGEWANLLFDLRPLLTFEEILKAWEEERIEDVNAHNEQNVLLTFLLWITWKFVLEEI